MKNKNWLLWQYLADILDDFFDWYCDEDDPEFPLTAEQCYKLIQYIIRKQYEE